VTTLVVEELITTLEQVQTIEKRMNLERIRLYLLRNDVNSGQLTLTVKRGATIIDSSTINILDITSSTYFHGMVSFEFINNLTVNPGDITLELSSSGYTYAVNNYIGWISEYINTTNEPTTTPETDFQFPLSCQLWEYSERH